MREKLSCRVLETNNRSISGSHINYDQERCQESKEALHITSKNPGGIDLLVNDVMEVIKKKAFKKSREDPSQIKQRLRRLRTKDPHKCKFSSELVSPKNSGYELENKQLKTQIESLKKTLSQVRKDYVKEIMQYEEISDSKKPTKRTKAELNRYIDFNDLVDDNLKKLINHKISEIKSQ